MRFKLSRDDFMRFHRLTERQVLQTPPLASRLFWIRVTGWMFFGMAIYAMVDLWRTDLGVVIRLIPFTLYLVLALVVTIVGNGHLRRLYARSLLADDGWHLAEQTVEPIEDGLRVITKFGSADLLWTGIRSVRADAKNYLLYIEPGQGFVVPKAAVDASPLGAELEQRAAQ